MHDHPTACVITQQYSGRKYIYIRNGPLQVHDIAIYKLYKKAYLRVNIDILK